MPLIVIDGPVIDTDKKRRLVAGLTRVASEIYDLPEQVITVLIRENRPENVGVAGKLLVDRSKGD